MGLESLGSSYLFKLLLSPLPTYISRYSNNILSLRNTFFKGLKGYVRSTISELNKLHADRLSLDLTQIASSEFMLRVVLCHLHEHKFPHDFMDLLDPISECGKDSKSTKYLSTPYATFKKDKLSFKILKVLFLRSCRWTKITLLNSKVA